MNSRLKDKAQTIFLEFAWIEQMKTSVSMFGKHDVWQCIVTVLTLRWPFSRGNTSQTTVCPAWQHGTKSYATLQHVKLV